MKSVSFDNDKIIKKIKIDENTNISIIEKLDDKEVNIIIIELGENEEELEKQKFLEFGLLENVIKKYLQNEIILTLNIEKEDINKNIYFLDIQIKNIMKMGKKPYIIMIIYMS